MGVEKLLDLAWVDVLASPDDHVAESPDDPEVSVDVHRCKVAGVHPAIVVDRVVGRVLVVPVPEHDAVSTRAQLTRFAAGYDPPRLGVDDLDFDMRVHPSDGRDTSVNRVVAVCLSRDRRGFGHAVANGDLANVHPVAHLFHDFDRTGRASHDAGAEAGYVRLGKGGVVELCDEHRWHTVERGAAFGTDGREGGGGLECLARHDDTRAVTRARESAHHHTEAVIKGYRDADPVGFRVSHHLTADMAVVEMVSNGARRDGRR